MKRKCSALLAVILAIAMLVTMIPSMAFAADEQSQIGGYQMVDPATGESVSGTAGGANTSADGLVSVEKSIEQVTENLFRITLNVTTKNEFDASTTSEDAGVVLVIDTSGSMKESTGGGWGSNSKLYAAKKAAQAFINKFADSNATRKVAIVEFGSNVKGTPTWKDAKDLKTANDTTFCDDLKNLRADGGTNMDAAFQSAKTQLDSLKSTSGIQNLNVVVLTDGQPTYYGTGDKPQGLGNNANHATHQAAEKAAKALTDAGYHMYAVYVGNEELACVSNNGQEYNLNCALNHTKEERYFDHRFWNLGWHTRTIFDHGTAVDKWLQNNCGFTTFTANDISGLTKTFEDIASQIELKAKAGVVTDPMGALMQFVDDSVITADLDNTDPSWSFAGNTLTWDLKKSGCTEVKEDGTELYTYTYTLSYDVELNTLDPNFAAGTYYPTNGTTSMTYSVTKENETTLGNIYFNIPTVKGFAGSYTFRKLEAETNLPLAGVEFTLTTADDDTWSKTVYSDTDGNVAIADLPSGHTYTLDETGALPGYEEITTNAGIRVSFGECGSSLAADNDVITNTPVVYSLLYVNKIWDDNNNNDGKRPGSITVSLFEADEKDQPIGDALQTITVTEQSKGRWYGYFEDVPAARGGQLLNYTVVEEAIPGYTGTVEITKGQMPDGVPAGDYWLNSFTITNTHEDEQVLLTITKKWNDNDDNEQKRPDEITVAVNANGDKVEMVTLTAENDWTATLEMPKYQDSQEIVYTILEEELPEGYTDSYDQATLTVTNTYGENEKTTLDISKVWDDNNNNDGKRPDSIDVEILANGQVAQTVTLRADDSWKYSVTLPKYENGAKIAYTIREKDVPTGYTSTVNGMTITNTYGGNEQATLTITKTWKDNDNKSQKRPDSIDVEILADGQVVEEVTLNAQNNWKMEIQLDKYRNGQEIVYTVREKNIPDGYSAEYDQSTLTITNTYTVEPTPTPTPVPPETPDTPATGAASSVALWSILMLSAAVLLIGSVLLKKRLNA